MFYLIFVPPKVKRSAIISNKRVIYELPHEFPSDLRLRLGSYEMRKGQENLITS